MRKKKNMRLTPAVIIMKLFSSSLMTRSNKLQHFVPGKSFQSSLMFVGKARSLPQSGAPERHFTQIGSDLTCKHYTRLEGLTGTTALAYYEKA